MNCDMLAWILSRVILDLQESASQHSFFLYGELPLPKGSSPHKNRQICILIPLQQLAFLTALSQFSWFMGMTSGLKVALMDDGVASDILSVVGALVERLPFLLEQLMHVSDCMDIICSCINPLCNQLVMVKRTCIWECELQE